VREEVEVTAADTPGRNGDAGPVPAGKLGLGQLGEAGRKLRVDHVEDDGAHGSERTPV
jgi:hypothetical protein